MQPQPQTEPVPQTEAEVTEQEAKAEIQTPPAAAPVKGMNSKEMIFIRNGCYQQKKMPQIITEGSNLSVRRQKSYLQIIVPQVLPPISLKELNTL